ncbi:MAG TPA: PHB depolymerase family esterase [Methylocella sp.]|nr:PHB depolymerase family esterase [Methylocella sp.]
MERQVAFGSNPGNLDMYCCLPEGTKKLFPLVVALHGCNQSAKDFDLMSGWSELGREHGFAVMFPEQKCGNNPQNCFNWFIEKHISSDDGEIASIRAMIEKMLAEHPIDRNRVFVTGLSAGGAMSCALLALFPDLFEAGAIIAGLPYGAALNPIDAITAMAFGPSQSSRELGNLIRRASPHQKRWPKVSIWHGSLDGVVAPANAQALVEQWLDIHQVSQAGGMRDEIDGQTRLFWCNGPGHVVVEHYLIHGMAHGLPAEAGAALYDSGNGMWSTMRIAESWGLLARQPLEAEAPFPAHESASFFGWPALWSAMGRVFK